MATLKQIITSDGWFAKFKQNDGISYSRLLCFGLFSDDDISFTSGIQTEPGLTWDAVEDTSNFIGYEYLPHEDKMYFIIEDK